jgi:hypothetical protein
MRNGLWTKGIGIGIVILFLWAGVLPSVSSEDQLDQYQTIAGYGSAIHQYTLFAQSFTPSLDRLTRVELLINKLPHFLPILFFSSGSIRTV